MNLYVIAAKPNKEGSIWSSVGSFEIVSEDKDNYFIKRKAPYKPEKVEKSRIDKLTSGNFPWLKGVRVIYSLNENLEQNKARVIESVREHMEDIAQCHLK